MEEKKAFGSLEIENNNTKSRKQWNITKTVPNQALNSEL